MFREQGQVLGVRPEEDRSICHQGAQRLVEEGSQVLKQSLEEGEPLQGLHTDPGVRMWSPVLSGSAQPPATCGSNQGVFLT